MPCFNMWTAPMIVLGTLSACFGGDSRDVVITSITPNKIQSSTARTLDLAIENLPELPGQLLCVFTIGETTLTTEAIKQTNGIKCTNIPSIPVGLHNITAKLSVRSDFFTTKFNFFDCNSYSSCTQCVSSDFPCDWCMNGHRCTHDTAENCRNDILITGVSRVGPSFRSGPAFCPTIIGTNTGSREILVASNSKKAVNVKVHIVSQFIAQSRFECQFNIESRVFSVNAQLRDDDVIHCDPMKFTYTSQLSNINASFAVIWGGSKPLDNPDNVHVNIYKCPDLANNCGLCLALPEKYRCGWCESSKRCEIFQQCDNGLGVWLKRDHTCPI
ncbi:plexin A3-like isoform X1 [Diaphorina citri]|uniref:Plexin A3-like isoform X1 n=1 Tax=Diaphorina citri TaxID=121845 RepID=A0A1S3D4D9_DIACI|nr:plexin A3-like isoform X2 [Diaphorina citri]XP_026680871.1 plexin A3-like isoform X1 [Diaphorina citri]